jgi:uncharacterized oxidoreductase
MNTTHNTILITGGSSGIGLALAERFLNAGNEVIVCARREVKLQEVKKRHPKIHTRVCDMAKEKDRIALFEWATSEFPRLNVLVNNAGIQRRVPLTQPDDWKKTREEIEINFEAPVHLCRLFVPHLTKQEGPAIINVTSGLAFSPISFMAIYCATKAAFHSFTLSLRHQLSKTPVKVYEIVPPAVNTDLGGPGLHDDGVPLNEFADHAFEGLKQDQPMITFGFSEIARRATPDELQKMFANMNRS